MRKRVRKRRVREVKMKELRRCVSRELAREQVGEKNREDNTKLLQIGKWRNCAACVADLG